MLDKTQFWILTALAAASAVLAIANMVLYQGNRTVQSEVNGRQQFIQQSIQLEVLYREMVKALADLSIRNRDAELSEFLRNQGVTISSGTAGAAPSPNATPGGAANPGAK